MLLTHPENLRIDEVNNYGHLYVPLFELYGASVGVWFYPDEDLETPLSAAVYYCVKNGYDNQKLYELLKYSDQVIERVKVLINESETAG